MDAGTYAKRLILLTEGGNGDKGNFFFRATSDLASAVFTPQLGIANLHFAAERVTGLTVGHGLQQFVKDQTDHWVARVRRSGWSEVRCPS